MDGQDPFFHWIVLHTRSGVRKRLVPRTCLASEGTVWKKVLQHKLSGFPLKRKGPLWLHFQVMHSSWSDFFPFSIDQLRFKQPFNKFGGVLKHFAFGDPQQVQSFLRAVARRPVSRVRCAWYTFYPAKGRVLDLKVVKQANHLLHCQARTDSFDQGKPGCIIVDPPQRSPVCELA